MRRFFLLLLFLAAPLLGGVIGFAQEIPVAHIPRQELHFSLESLEKQTDKYADKVSELQGSVGFIKEMLREQQRQYEQQQQLLEKLAQKSQAQKVVSDKLYEAKIVAKLGTPFDIFTSNKVEIKFFELKENGYRGYAAKVKLLDPAAMRVVLAKDSYGEKETTSEAVSRTGAVFGINGGGFYQAIQDGEEIAVPIGNTVIRGDIVKDFTPTRDDLFFSGWTKRGELIGGLYSQQKQLLADSPWYGVSFVPILFDQGRPLPLPERWQQEKHPRTVIGNYANGDILLMVIDGRRKGWSNGISLEGLQLKLHDLGVVDAYNLDGGGSSTFVYNGKVLNRPSDGRERPVTTNIVVMP